jgi:uncharacterized protein with FMN-binding domain
MRMKKVILFVIVILCLVCSVLFFLRNIIRYEMKIKNTGIENIDFSTMTDGIYEGYYDVYLVSAKVIVKVKNGKVIDIDLLEHKHGEGYSAEQIVDTVLAKQTLGVDAISGATGSSKTILKAIEIALKSEKK